MMTSDKKNNSKIIGRLDRKVRRLGHDLDSVHKTADLLTGPMDLGQVLEIVVKTIAKALDLDAAGLRLLDDSGNLVLKATHGLSDGYINKGPVTVAESSLNTRALQGEAIIVDDMRSQSDFQKHHDQIIKEGVISSLSIGLRYKDKGIGILRLYNKRPRRFSESDISLARTVASQSAAAIINARLYKEALEGERMARQVRLAGTVQRHMIPRHGPKIPGIDLAGVYVPCYDVGGDFYDLIELADGKLIMVIGDVMGKGVPASLAMASLRASMRAYAEMTDSIEIIVTRVNRTFCRDVESGEFATLFCALFEPERSLLTYCNCGHEPPILLRNNTTTDLSQGGTVLGIDKNSKFKTSTAELLPGDMLIMYTDGLADALNFNREPFGRARIIEGAKASDKMSAANAAKNILWLMRKYTGLTKRFDDTALVIMKKL